MKLWQWLKNLFMCNPESDFVYVQGFWPDDTLSLFNVERHELLEFPYIAKI
jgi:hypothetical protein